MYQPIRGRGGHLVYPIGPKNTKLVGDVEILLPVKCHWIPFSGFKTEVENVSANQRPGRPTCFSNRPEKYKLGRGRWYLATCQMSLNSVQRFQNRSRKCLSLSEAMAAILFFRSLKKHKPRRGRWDLASCQFSFNYVQRFQRRSRKCLSKSEARAAILFFSDRPGKHKVGMGHWDLSSCQVSLNSVQWLQRRNRKCLSQSEARGPSDFSYRSEKHKLGRGLWYIATCQVSLNSI